MFFKNENITPSKPISFGWNCRWLAVHSEDAEFVAHLLELKILRMAAWNSGISAASNSFIFRRLFVIPALSGWVLILNYQLPDYRSQDVSADHLARISSGIGGGRVCWFSSFSSVSCHAWGFAENGTTKRLYGYSDGRKFFDYGDIDTAEIELNQLFRDDYTADNDADYERLMDERSVFLVAQKWSINPTTISDVAFEPCVGFVAKHR